MDNSLVSYHIRDKDQESVIAAVRFGRFTPAWVSPKSGRWVSVFPESAESEDPELLNRIGTILSRTLDTFVWSVWLQNSKILCYTVFERGEIKAEYDSFPEVAVARTKRYIEKTNGEPELMASLCPDNVQVDAIRQVLYRKPLKDAISEVMREERIKDEKELFETLPEQYIQDRIMSKRGYREEEERLADLAALLDISNALCTYGVLERYFMQDIRGLVPDEDSYLRIK